MTNAEKFIEVMNKTFAVMAWMPLPEPYKEGKKDG